MKNISRFFNVVKSLGAQEHERKPSKYSYAL